MFYVLAYKFCKDCKTVKILYKTRINFRFLSYTFLSLGWSLKTKYLIYFQTDFQIARDLSDCTYSEVKYCTRKLSCTRLVLTDIYSQFL